MTTETNQPTAESSPTPGASRHYELPPLGENPSSTAEGPLPAALPCPRGLLQVTPEPGLFSSPDTPECPCRPTRQPGISCPPTGRCGGF
ncbi:MAG: hypothetical protein Ct9H300mP1_31770 [Planctomycetaceae bacterium]|nr:MAG: hypothetical protein Ct9H300mP1_31770 [Planctomycetaceae bacterium]